MNSSEIERSGEQTYTIKELSSLFCVTASTLRYYEELGLLTGVERTKGNQRIYTDTHVLRMKAISCFKETGLSISGMQKFFMLEQNLPERVDEIIDLVTEHEKEIIKQIVVMQSNLEHIQKKVRFYKAMKKAYEEGASFPCYDEV